MHLIGKEPFGVVDFVSLIIGKEPFGIWGGHLCVFKYNFQVNFLYAHVIFMLLIDFFAQSIVSYKISTNIFYMLM